MIKPIDPENVQEAKNCDIPDVIIKVVNEMIVEKWDGSSSTIKQENIVKAVEKRSEYTSEEIYNNKWMDFEDLFTRAGWKVKYDKPAYCESYDATFEFSKDKK